MRIPFSKMHGASNDYIYLDCMRGLPVDGGRLPELARAVSDRHSGVGSDGLILILPPPDGAAGASFGFRMFNSDGSEGEMCGNGMRCFARYVVESGLTSLRSFTVATLAGPIGCQIDVAAGEGPWTVTCDLGEPRVLASQVPTILPAGADGIVRDHPFRIDGHTLLLTAVSPGNPHAVAFVADPDALPWRELGRAMEFDPAFPKRANIEFVRVDARDRAYVRVWERGSGETLACGTGACAVVVAGVLTGRLDRRATVRLPGGELQVEWSAVDGRVRLTGPAARVCDGEFYFVT